MRPAMNQRLCFLKWIAVAASVVMFQNACTPSQAGEAALRVAAFAADITPPLGEPIGFTPPVATIEHPLAAKGLVLRDGGGTYVLCSLDLALVSNGSYALLRQKLAEAAGTAASRVALHEVQQHTAGALDLDMQRLLEAEKSAPKICSRAYFDRVAESTAAAVREAAGRLLPATHVGWGSAAVERVAAARRVRMPDGRIVTRWSAARDPALRELPEGVIDPLLRTVAFFDGERPLAYLHFYAMHPQSYYGDGRVTYDVPGLARQRLEKESGVAQIYFSGCGGNVTMGKYNDGTPEARQALADRLYDGMTRSVKSIRRQAAMPIVWKTTEVRLPLRSGKEFEKGEARRLLADPAAPPASRMKAAMLLSWIERVKAGQPVEIACLGMGPLRILSLPGEPFVEYQLWAQQQCPDQFVATAAFGDFGMCYVCTDQAYADQGGYEQTFTFVDPCESLLKQAIAEVLGTPAKSSIRRENSP